MREGETNRAFIEDKSHHDHLYFGSLCAVFLDDIIEKYNLSQFHGHIILCPTDTTNILVHFELCLNTSYKEVVSLESDQWRNMNYRSRSSLSVRDDGRPHTERGDQDPGEDEALGTAIE